PHSADRRHGAAAPGAHIIPAFVRGGMIVTVERYLGRPAVALLILLTLLATSRPLLAQPTTPAAAPSAGEASLVLPDLSSVDFQGIKGSTLLMSGLVVCALGL